MTLLVPNVGEVKMLNLILDQDLTLKLYSNDKTPAEGDTASSYTEVAGGNYSSKDLLFANWTITSGNPSFGVYLSQDFNFTDSTDSPGTIYGYYVVNDDGVLMWAERFPALVLPFSPVNGSIVRITPRFEVS